MAEGNFEVCEVIVKESGFHNITRGTKPDWVEGKITFIEISGCEFWIYLTDDDKVVTKVRILYGTDEMVNLVLSLRHTNREKSVTLLRTGTIMQDLAVVVPSGYDTLPDIIVGEDGILDTDEWDMYIKELIKEFLKK